MHVKKLMTKQARTCSPDDRLSRVAQIMWDADVGFLPVVDAEQLLVGVVTDRDVCMAAYTQGARLEELRVESVMSRNVFTCRPDDAISVAEELMRQRQLRRLPVTDVAGKLAGVITVGDLCLSSQRNRLSKALTATRLANTWARIYAPRRPAAAAE
jgi:CBS domain-containing protein